VDATALPLRAGQPHDAASGGVCCHLTDAVGGVTSEKRWALSNTHLTPSVMVKSAVAGLRREVQSGRGCGIGLGVGSVAVTVEAVVAGTKTLNTK
jgi:hypothetical protein